MAKFLTFETTAVKLNDSIFPSNSATFGLQAATVPVFDINGNLIDYAPNGPIQGKFSTEFYLTGALPNYLKFDNQSDAPISVSFNNFNIPSAFLTDLSFSVEPYQPISVSASFDFYHGIISLSTDLNDTHNLFSPADGTNKVKNKLATLNGLSSYIITYNRSTYKENPDDFIVSNFSYSFTVDRQPLLRVKQSIPSRVALKQVNGQFSITSNNIDGLLDIHGNDAIFNAVLADPQNPATYTSIGLTGIITDQNYVISDSNYGVGTVKMVQSITKKRNIISIPFGTNDPAIVEVSLPVESVYVPPTIVPPVTPPRRPNPIPPPTPPPIIIIPPPGLNPKLIWFKFFAGVTVFSDQCASKKNFSLANQYATSFEGTLRSTVSLQPVKYILEFAKQYTSIVVEQKDNYYICSIGVNENVLKLDMTFTFPQQAGDNSGVDFSRPFNEFFIDDPCLQHDIQQSDPTSIYRFAAMTIKYNYYSYNGTAEECQLQSRQNGGLNPPAYDANCPAIKRYPKWVELIPLMQAKYNNDLSRESYLSPYEIILPLLLS